MRRLLISLFGSVGFFAALSGTPDRAAADKIKHSIAVFSGLDKITGRIMSFEVATNETVQFGSLQITERVCYTRPPTEAPQTDTFVEVDDLDANNNAKRIFTGWMFAASPGLHALDEPVYDIWLTDCKGDTQLISSPPPTAEVETPPPADVVTPLPQQPAKPPQPKPKRAPANASAQSQQNQNGPIEVGPPPGFVPPRRQQRVQTQRSFPAPIAPPDSGF